MCLFVWPPMRVRDHRFYVHEPHTHTASNVWTAFKCAHGCWSCARAGGEWVAYEFRVCMCAGVCLRCYADHWRRGRGGLECEVCWLVCGWVCVRFVVHSALCRFIELCDVSDGKTAQTRKSSGPSCRCRCRWLRALNSYNHTQFARDNGHVK